MRKGGEKEGREGEKEGERGRERNDLIELSVHECEFEGALS